MQFILSKLSGSQAVFVYRALGALKGPALMTLIVTYLDDVEQGEWFLFASLGAISALVDLGFGTMISNFIANAHGKGIMREVSYLVDLTRITYLRLSVIGVGLMLLVGLFIIPGNIFLYFIAYILANGFNLAVSWKTISFMGLNRVKEAHVALSSGVVASTAVLIVLVPAGFTLLALVASVFAQGCVLFGVLKYYQKSTGIEEMSVSYNHEDYSDLRRNALKIFTKYAVSWVFGFLIFNAYVPIISKKIGLEESGKVGLLLAMYSACLSISLTWIQAYNPKIAMLRGKGQWREAIDLWKRAVIFAFALLSSGIACVFLLTNLDVPQFPLNQKLPSRFIMASLAVVFIVRLWGSVTATFIRAGKGEKHTVINVCTGCFMIAALLSITRENQVIVFGVICLYSLIVLAPAYTFLVKNDIAKSTLAQ